MNHVTIRDEYTGMIEVEVLLNTPEGYQKIGALIERCKLREYIEGFEQSIIWRDNISMEFCLTEGCNELIRKGNPCPLCLDCLQEYREHQKDSRAERNLRAYAGVIG